MKQYAEMCALHMHFFETALLPGQRLSLDGCDTPLPTLCQYTSNLDITNCLSCN